MHTFFCAQLLSLLLLVVIRAHWRIKLAWRCTIYDLSTSSQQYLLRSVDHARVLIVVSWVRRSLLVLTILLLLKHLLVLHLLKLLLLLLQVELSLLLWSGRLHGGSLRAYHCWRVVGRHHAVVLRLQVDHVGTVLVALATTLITRLHSLIAINLLVAGALQRVLRRHASADFSKLI